LKGEDWRDLRSQSTSTLNLDITPHEPRSIFLSLPLKMHIRLSISRNSGLLPSLKPSRSLPHLPTLLTRSRKMSTQPMPTFSSNYSPEQGIKDLSPLLKSNGGKWSLIESGKGVERSFKFKTFKKTWVFPPSPRLPFPRKSTLISSTDEDEGDKKSESWADGIYAGIHEHRSSRVCGQETPS
jgi:hypothetical protein